MRANASSVGSVVFTDAVGSSRVESNAPYAYKGDSGGTYNAWSPAAGTYVINAQPFSGIGGTGTAGAVATLTLIITAAPPPPPSSPLPPTVVAHTYTKNDGPPKNPFKGWNSGGWSTPYDDETVGSQIAMWKDLEKSKDADISEDVIINTINNSGSKDRHVIFRILTDYEPWYFPNKTGNDKYDAPAWLFEDPSIGIDPHIYWSYWDDEKMKGNQDASKDGRNPINQPAGSTDIAYPYITDYNNENFLIRAVSFINRFAAVIKKNSSYSARIFVMQFGFLGEWGEWNLSTRSWGYDDPTKNKYGIGGIKDSTKKRIVDAMVQAFAGTDIQFQGRYPSDFARDNNSPNKPHVGNRIGYHNDCFFPDACGSNDWDQEINKYGLWLNGPTGGETPSTNDQQVNMMYGPQNQGETMIRTGHYSTMAGGFRQAEGKQYSDGSKKLHRLMGYNFQIESATFADTLSTADTMPIQLMATNIGVAPTYNAWDIQFALLNGKDEPMVQAPADFRLATVLPQGSFTLSTNLSPSSVPPGNYRLGVRVIQQGAALAKAASWNLDPRNTYMLWANNLLTVDGSWDTKNALQGGWSILGTISLR